MEVERSTLIEIAQEKLYEVISILERACKGDGNAKAYIIDHLEIIAGEGHGFLSRDLNLSNLIERYSGDNGYSKTVNVDEDWYSNLTGDE